MSTTRATKRAPRESITPRHHLAAKKSASPVRHHLDRRASDILAQPSAANDALMSTKELATFLRVSDQFLEIARSKNYGPPFVRVSDRMIRYRMDDVRKWLAKRVYCGTAEYRSAAKGAP
jgi:hypothetical protein